MRTPAPVVAATGLLALLLGVNRAHAHPHDTTPPVDVTIVIQGTEVTALVDMERIQILSWGERPDPRRSVDAPITGAQALEKLKERMEVSVDGVVVAPVLVRFGDPPLDETVNSPHVKIAVAYPVTRKPTSLGVRWKDFFGIHWEGGAQLPLLVEADAQVESTILSKAEPEYVWHRKPPAAFRTSAAPPPAASEGSRIPVLPLALGALALALPFVPPLRRRGGATRWLPAGAAAGAAAALLVAGVGAVEVGHAVPPTEAQAKTVFTSLLHNVYRAMDAKTETEIYDLLAASVERPILDGLYGDIYESLVLRDQGGVKARVEDVTVEAVAIAYPPEGGASRFTATATWQLKAAVSHLGHTHRRQNRYRAEVLLRRDGTAWRIASVTMLERKRLDDGRGGLLDAPRDIAVPGEPEPTR